MGESLCSVITCHCAYPLSHIHSFIYVLSEACYMYVLCNAIMRVHVLSSSGYVYLVVTTKRYYCIGWIYVFYASFIIKIVENLIYLLLLVLLHKKGGLSQESQISWHPVISLMIRVVQPLRELL